MTDRIVDSTSDETSDTEADNINNNVTLKNDGSGMIKGMKDIRKITSDERTGTDKVADGKQEEIKEKSTASVSSSQQNTTDMSLTSRLLLENKILEKLMDHLEKDTPSDRSKSLHSVASSIFDRLVDTLEKPSPDSDAICRICFGSERAHLLSICQCKGTIGYVHLECIERWLQECGMDTCDLCKYKFITVRKPTQSMFKSLFTWVTHVDNEEDIQELVSDFAATFLFSPFILVLTITGYQTIVSRSAAYLNSDQLIFSLSGTLSMFSLFTLVSAVNSIGFSWLCYIGQKHYSRWTAWYRKSTTVRIVLPDGQTRT